MKKGQANHHKVKRRPASIHAHIPSGTWNSTDIRVNRDDLLNERDHSLSMKYAHTCGLCGLPILFKHQSSHSDGTGTFHLRCEFNREPVRIEASREAAAQNGHDEGA